MKKIQKYYIEFNKKFKIKLNYIKYSLSYKTKMKLLL